MRPTVAAVALAILSLAACSPRAAAPTPQRQEKLWEHFTNITGVSVLSADQAKSGSKQFPTSIAWAGMGEPLTAETSVDLLSQDLDRGYQDVTAMGEEMGQVLAWMTKQDQLPNHVVFGWEVPVIVSSHRFGREQPPHADTDWSFTIAFRKADIVKLGPPPWEPSRILDTAAWAKADGVIRLMFSRYCAQTETRRINSSTSASDSGGRFCRVMP